MDGKSVAQRAPRFEGALLATGAGDDFGAPGDLVAPGAALAGPECYSVGNGRSRSEERRVGKECLMPV